MPLKFVPVKIANFSEKSAAHLSSSISPRLPPPQPSNPFQCLRQLTIIFGPAKVIVPLISPSQFVLSPPTPHLRPPVLKSNEKSRLGQSAVAAAAFLSFVPNKTTNKQIP
jgi:hypothetical protein